MCFGGNQLSVILIPITKPAPIELNSKREITNCINDVPNANINPGITVITIKPENTTLGPCLSTNDPTTIRAGMVNATLQSKRDLKFFISKNVNASTIADFNGAMLNQTKKVKKNAIHV